MQIRDGSRRVVLDEQSRDLRTYPPMPVEIVAAPSRATEERNVSKDTSAADRAAESRRRGNERMLEAKGLAGGGAARRRMSDQGRENIRAAALARRARERAERQARDDLQLLRANDPEVVEREVVAEWTRGAALPPIVSPFPSREPELVAVDAPEPELAEIAGALAVAVADQPPVPCVACLHAEVCRFRHLVAEPDEPVAFVREVHPGIRLRAVRVEVECDHQLTAAI